MCLRPEQRRTALPRPAAQIRPTAAHRRAPCARRRAALYPLAAVRQAALYPLAAVLQAAGKKKRTTISSRKGAESKRCPKYGRNKHCTINRPPKTVAKGKGAAVRRARFLQRKKAELLIEAPSVRKVPQLYSRAASDIASQLYDATHRDIVLRTVKVANIISRKPIGFHITL